MGDIADLHLDQMLMMSEDDALNMADQDLDWEGAWNQPHPRHRSTPSLRSRLASSPFRSATASKRRSPNYSGGGIVGELAYASENREGRRTVTKVARIRPKGTGKLVVKKKARVSSAGTSTPELSLPTTRSQPSSDLGDYTTLLFGEKKIGKTDLTAQMEKTIHLMTEPGGKAQAIFQRAINNWRDFIGYVKLLEKDKRFATVSVDTADLLYSYAFDFVSRRDGFEHPSEEAYGKGWKAIRDEFTKWVLRLINTGKGIVFVSHATEKEVKMRSGEKYDRIQPTMAGQAMDVLTGMVDLWFYYGYDGDRRVLTIQGNDHIGAGHRLKNNFKYPDGTAISEIDMGLSAEEGWANLMAAFNNTLPKPVVEERKTTGVVKKKKLTFKKKKKV